MVRKPLRTEVHLGFAFPPVAPKEAIVRPVGIDAGVAKRLTLSDGGEVAKREVDRGRLRRLQRAVARAAPGSGNRRKKVGSLAREWQRISDANRQALHRTVSALSRAYDFFAIEDLRIANLLRSAKGTAAEPGRNVRAKAGLNRAISEQGWGTFFTLLKEKAASAGLQVVEVRAAWNQPGLLGMRRRGAEESGCSGPRLSGLRAGAGPRCQCGKEYPAAGFGPFTGGEWRGDPASRCGGRSGEPIILRSKRGSGAARRRTASCQVMFINPNVILYPAASFERELRFWPWSFWPAGNSC